MVLENARYAMLEICRLVPRPLSLSPPPPPPPPPPRPFKKSGGPSPIPHADTLRDYVSGQRERSGVQTGGAV